jgi:hypothetical protein
MNHTDPHELVSHDARTYADAARAGGVAGGTAVGSSDAGDGCAPHATKRYSVPTFRRIPVVRTEGAGNFGGDFEAGDAPS